MTGTIYHRRDQGWERQVREDLWAGWSQGVSHTSGMGRSDQGQSTILIPWDQETEISPGDGILAGEGPKVQEGPLKAQLPEVQIIQTVVCHQVGSALDHWEVTAR
jgi:hypothetical protein